MLEIKSRHLTWVGPRCHKANYKKWLVEMQCKAIFFPD